MNNTNTFKVLIISLIFVFIGSCKQYELESPVIEPPAYRNYYTWKETAIKKGTGEWKEISNGNILRLYTDYKVDADSMFGVYEYNGINANVEINTPPLIYQGFAKRNDSLFLKIPNDKGVEKSYVTLHCEILNDSEMIIRNEKSDPIVNIRYKR